MLSRSARLSGDVYTTRNFQVSISERHINNIAYPPTKQYRLKVPKSLPQPISPLVFPRASERYARMSLLMQGSDLEFFFRPLPFPSW